MNEEVNEDSNKADFTASIAAKNKINTDYFFFIWKGFAFLDTVTIFAIVSILAPKIEHFYEINHKV